MDFFFFLLDASEVLFPFTISYYSISLVVVREQGVHDINGNSLTCVFWIFLLNYNWKSENQGRQ